MQGSRITITGPTIYAENRIIEQGCVTVENGLIKAISVQDDTSADHVLLYPSTYHVIPGLIDVHIHGAAGYDVMDATSVAYRAISQALAAEGVTSFLATTMTADIRQVEAVLLKISEHRLCCEGANLLGVHLEGPFLSPERMGAQRKDRMLYPSVDLAKHWQILSEHAIKLVTLAPEQPHGDDLIQYLVSKGIVASMGHTNATYQQAERAIQAGCTHVTHLFNAMRAVHHREPGVAVAALLSDRVTVELIVDGLHLHPAMVDLVLKTKGIDNVILITDAMRAKCMGDGCYELGGQVVFVNEGKAQLADGALAGSLLKMPLAIKNTMTYTRCTLADAVRMASHNPAKMLGIAHQKGTLAVNKDADLVVLNEELDVVMTMRGGKVVYPLRSYSG